MTSDEPAGIRILGSLRAVDGKGVVRMEDRLDTDIDNVWSAITDPVRLDRWLGTVEGDLRQGGEYRFHFYASESEGTGRVEVCEPSRRLLLTMALGTPGENVIEVTLAGAGDGDGTIVVWEERGVPLEYLVGYGAGVQIHVEDLAAYLAGRERCDARARWRELQAAYEDLAANVA
jgi:uncharacterized protein YndB with AHSA1/START domain